MICYLLPSQLPEIWVAKCSKPSGLQIRNHYALELQQVGSMLRLKMLRCIFHHLVVLPLATKTSIITAEAAWNDGLGPSHYCSLNFVSSVFCIVPDSQLSTLSGCKTECEPVMPLASSASLIVGDSSLLWSHCSEKMTRACWC